MNISTGREMTRFEKFRRDLAIRATRLRRRLPYFVWHGQEIDVRVTFSENRLPQNSEIDAAMNAFQCGALPKVERDLAELGVVFDTGLGFEGREWEWDWSLRGPIKVTFQGASSRKH